MTSMALAGTTGMVSGIRDRVASSIKDAPDRQTKDLLKDILTALDKPYNLDWVKEEYKLTPTEFRVLNLLVEGKNAARISEITGTQISTVRVHIYRIYSKMNVSHATELTALLLRRARFI